MKVIGIFCGLIASTVFCAVQAQNKAFFEQPVNSQKKSAIWRYFARKKIESKQPTYAVRLKASFQNWLTSKPQITVKPKPFVSQLEREWDEALLKRNKALKAYENSKGSQEYSEFLKKQKEYENIGKKFYDLKLKELFKT